MDQRLAKEGRVIRKSVWVFLVCGWSLFSHPPPPTLRIIIESNLASCPLGDCMLEQMKETPTRLTHMLRGI